MSNPVNMGEIFGNVSGLFPNLDSILWGLVAVILSYTVIHAVIFVYHWHKYNIAPGPFLQMTYIVYFSGIGVFSLSILLSLVAILN